MDLIFSFSEQYETQIQRLGLSSIDIAFASFIFQMESAQTKGVALLAGLVSQKLSQQDSCLNINNIDFSTLQILGFDSTKSLLMSLEQARSVNVDNQQIEAKPIIFENNNLYLQRYHQYEVSLANIIQNKLGSFLAVDQEHANTVLTELFSPPPANQEKDTDWQKVAVCIAATRSFSLITGGPGTGKTTTVAKLLALLQGLASKQGKPLKIQLVAPTGKAAARLTESLLLARDRLPLQYRWALDVQCSTIHRLLGSQPARVDFKHNQQNMLHLDVLIVDEASMVDLPLMSKLLGAVPIASRVILLGDQNQLSSVEAGSVLADICQAALQGTTEPVYSAEVCQLVAELSGEIIPPVEQQRVSGNISDCLVKLQKSHRFSASSPIGQLAKHVIQGEVNKGLTLLSQQQSGEGLSWYKNATLREFVRSYASLLSGYFGAIKLADIGQAFALLEKQQILCAQKNGSWGVENLNFMIEQELNKQGHISLDRKDYYGRPIMLSQNDHGLGIFNGDIGIIMADPEQPQLIKAWFKTGHEQYNGIVVSRLPRHDTVYAMTIHKSQGSEFEKVVLCLPESRDDKPIMGLSRELFYTGLTRAKQRFELYGQQHVLEKCLQSACYRSSGLAQRL
ncbi:exodeoxyribonuclease V subunit alpha [Aliiglaciecola sp. LCG003]|uniref:exodeoxyribonuclease V subunit alpha n=1 Tax=Aliiglaciecola sp. LCG003 TaxID=3053655 RepID=UPI002572E820|nr:exodeoxyribonuclease V subunit alpha [Aliiglaciecola sp. LCG003]WJG07928.1 exodeoxyribonuclease V subunit alpha [Aliiglaciecola sp. LCG003]